MISIMQQLKKISYQKMGTCSVITGALFLVKNMYTEKKGKIKISITEKPIASSLRSESKEHERFKLLFAASFQ